MTDFATGTAATTTSMTAVEMVAGLTCDNYTLGRLNWLLRQLFGGDPVTVITAGPGVLISGGGTPANPFVVSLDIPVVAALLCGDSTFQACLAGTPIAPIAPASAPFSDSNIQGSVMAITRGTFTGTAPITLAATGIPAGVTFADNGNGTYTLTGTWPAVGAYTYAVAATNSAGTTNMPGNQLISTAAAVAPIVPAAGPFTDTGTTGTAI